MSQTPLHYELAWRPRAYGDLASIFEYIGMGGGSAPVAHFKKTLYEKIALLKIYPEMGRQGRTAGTRELVVHPNYIVFYEVNNSLIEIMRIKHAAQQWPLPL